MPDLPEVGRTCNECRFAIFKDYGYSNYTVEGTEFFCAIKAHPADGFDRWFGGDQRLWFAAECGSFSPGEAIGLDVEGEDYDDLTDEQKAIYEAWDGEPTTQSDDGVAVDG